MGARDVLAANLRALLDSHATVNTVLALEQATERIGVKVGKSTIQRALTRETPLNLDYIEAIAKVFELDTWQLLVQNLAPKNPPVLRSIGEAEDQVYKKMRSAAQEIVKLTEGQP